MRNFIKTKKGIATLATLVVVGASAFAAYAYFSSSGTGSGTATIGSNTTNITLYATVPSTIVPGDGGQAVTFKASNSSTTTTGYVATVSFASVTDPGGPAGCQSYLALHGGIGGDFSLTVDPLAEGNTVPANTNAGSAVPLTNGDTLVWANSAADQTPCANQPLQLNITST